MKYIFLLFSVLTQLPCSTQAMEPLYRILYAPPKEVARSLKTPLGTVETFSNKNKSSSRLDRYYKIMSKKVEGDNIDLKILILTPLFPDILSSTRTIDAQLKEIKKQPPNTFLYRGQFQNSLYKVDANLKISPHPSGSLLEIQPTESDAPELVVKGLTLIALELGFSRNDL